MIKSNPVGGRIIVLAIALSRKISGMFYMDNNVIEINCENRYCFFSLQKLEMLLNR